MATEIEPTVNPKELLVEMREKSDPEVFIRAMAFYHEQFTNTKSNVDQVAAGIYQLQDQIRFLNSLTADLHNLTDKGTHGIDLTDQPEIVAKLKVAQELGVKIKGDQLTFDSEDRQLLISLIHVKGDELEFDINRKVQILDTHHKHLDRVLLMMNEIRKSQHKATERIASNIKG